ncbi:CBS domain-containing protein [Bacillus sp. E214]|uniref:CBS domain-containing protein n=1 Tax=Bacillus sp. E214 TaxID=2587156 RepID=UPI0011DF06FE|nr:CBS domain-containing protein [Bacillus sp. E214]
MDSKEKSERFEIAYNIIDKKLRELKEVSYSRRREPFTSLLNSIDIPIINNYKEELISFAQLRNTIIHNKLEKDYYIAEPHNETVERIEFIAKQILVPKKAIEIAARKPVTFNKDDNIDELLDMMKTNDYSCFPIYDSKGFVGLVTSNGLSRWLADNVVKEGIIFSDYKIQHLLEYEYENNVIFLSERDDVFQVKEMFETQLSKVQPRLEAILISNSKKKHKDALLGIITPWDLIKIEK